MINISRLRELIKHLPDSFDPNDLSYPLLDELAAECSDTAEELREVKRKADEAELAAAEARVADLRAMLSIKQSQNVARLSEATRQPSALDETDAGNGIGEPRETGGSAESFLDELASLRERTQEKRRRLS